MSSMTQQRRKLSNYFPLMAARRKALHDTRAERRKIVKENAGKSEAAQSAALAEVLTARTKQQQTGWRKLVNKVKGTINRLNYSKPERQFGRGK